MGLLLKDKKGFILIDSLFFIYIIFMCVFMLLSTMQTTHMWIESNHKAERATYDFNQ